MTASAQLSKSLQNLFPSKLCQFVDENTSVLLCAADRSGYISHPKFDAVLGVLVLDDGPHLEPLLESARHVVGRLARLHRALDARAHPLFAKHAQQRPSRLLQQKRKELVKN